MLRSVVSNWLTLLVSGLSAFLLTPILLRSLGDWQYGILILASSLTDYSGLLDMGMRGTVQRFTARLHSSGPREALDETIATALAIALVTASVIAFGAVAMAGFIAALFASTPGDE